MDRLAVISIQWRNRLAWAGFHKTQRIAAKARREEDANARVGRIRDELVRYRGLVRPITRLAEVYSSSGSGFRVKEVNGKARNRQS